MKVIILCCLCMMFLSNWQSTHEYSVMFLIHQWHGHAMLCDSCITYAAKYG